MNQDTLLQIKMEFLEAFFFRRQLKALKKLGYDFNYEEVKVNLTQNLFLIRTSNDNVIFQIQKILR